MEINQNKSKKRLLYLMPGPLPPNKDPKLNKLYCLSDFLEGEILAPVWWKKIEGLKEYYGVENYPIFKVGSFDCHFFLAECYPSVIRTIAKIIYFVFKGIQLRLTKGKYDYIMSYGTNATGVSGSILKYIHGAKFIVEIPGVPEDGSRFDTPEASVRKNINQIFTDAFLYLVVSQADRTKLLYESQLKCYPRLDKIPASVFHDFVATETLESLECSDRKFILLLGFPWYRKGIDILIKAFLHIQNDFPEYQLKCVGWNTDKKTLLELANNNPRIHIIDSVPLIESYKLIASCSVLVLPSRSEAMGRVLLEAMAVKKPIIGANTNGIPTYVINNQNGLIFKNGDDQDLARVLRKILSDERYANSLGNQGYQYLKKELDESAYARKFKLMIENIDKAV